MNSGDLRHLVSLDVPTSAGIVPLDPATWWCTALEDRSGPTLFYGRFHPGITVMTRVHYKGRTYHVDQVGNRDGGRDTDLELVCHEVFDA